jgi:hypothetical protein
MELVFLAGAVLVLDILAYFFGYDSRGVTDNSELSYGSR